MEKSKTSPDQIIEELGGCGRYQIRMSVLVHVIKMLICWSVNFMVILSATPMWSCGDNQEDVIGNGTLQGSATNISLVKSCYTRNNTKCTKFEFEGELKTIVSEFDLVCHYDFIPSTIMSIQLVGLLAGNMLSGQLADMFGRKRPFFASLVILIIGNFIGFLSVNWIMFAASRVLIGIGAGFFLSIQYSLLSEFSLSRWRSWIVGFPSWQVEATLLALVAWLIQDWRYIKLTITLFGIPCLFAWWWIPESFRWYIAHDRIEDAEKVIKTVGEFNRHEVSIQTKELLDANEKVKKDTRKYTFTDLFKSKYMLRVTLLSSLNWAGLGLISYGILYGVQALSGNLFLNFFLFKVTGIPTTVLAIWIQNKFGRRLSGILCYGVTAVGSIIVAVVQYIETDYRDELTNGFALFANMGIQTAWTPVQTMTIELYPTVIRTIGFGSLSVIGRVGAILGPQLVYLNSYVPGLLYFVCGGFSIVCCICLYQLPETANANLNDKIHSTTVIEDKTHVEEKTMENSVV